jgi:tRNA U38,U39,U40 pseudouridine synthase TruA
VARPGGDEQRTPGRGPGLGQRRPRAGLSRTTHDAVAREYSYYLYAATGEDGVSDLDDGVNDHDVGAPNSEDGAIGPDDGTAGPADEAISPEGVPPSRAARACEVLDRVAGEHDFHNLTPDESGTLRDLETAVAVEGPFLVVTVRADGFPRQLVRRLVSVVDEVACGGAGLDRVSQVLGEDALEGPDGVPPARPHPLVLTDVAYPGVDFAVDERAVASARQVFGKRYRRHATLARVAGRLRDRRGRPGR